MRKPTIARRLAAGFGLVILLFVVAGMILDSSVRKVGEGVKNIKSTGEPASSAAFEMEIQVTEISLGVRRYLDSGAQEERRKVQNSAEGFERSMSKYKRAVETPEERAAGKRTGELYDKLRTLGEHLMDERDERESLYKKSSDNFDEIDSLIDEKLQADMDTADPAATKKLRSTVRLEAEANGASTWFEAYLGKPKSAYKKRISTNAEDFRDELQNFESLNLSNKERDLADGLGARFGRTMKLVDRTISANDSIRSDNKRFVALSKNIDHVLDKKMQILTRRSLESTERQTDRTLARIRRVLLGLLLAGLLVGGGTAYLTSRNIIRPLRRLMEGARRVGQGDLTHRIEVSGQDEIGDLTNAFNQMAERRQRVEEEIHRLNEQLEERIRERTKQLVMSENRYRVVVERATEGIYIFDPATGHIRESNRAYQKLLGYTAEELTGMTVYDVVAHDRQSVDKYIEETVNRESHYLGERQHRRKDGSLVSVEVGTVMIPVGKEKLLCAIVRDITEHKQAENRLRETENRFRTLVEQIPAITYIDAKDDLSSTVYMSPQVEAVLGYTPEEWISEDGLWVNSLHPEDRERVLGEHYRTNETLEPFRMEYRMISRDGRVVWVRDEAVAVRNETDGTMRWQGILTDITERKQIEREAKQWARYSRDLFDVNLDALFTMDAEGNIQDANSSMVTMIGVPREDLIGRNIFDFLPDADLDREEFEDTLIRGYTQDYSSTIRAADGRRIPVVLNASVFRNEAEEITGIFVSVRDMSELNRLVQDMEHLALHDSLTGLPNRTLLFDRLDHALVRTRREEHSIGLLFVDLDRFKVVNDSLGHGAGDELLKASAARLRECLRAGDTLARIGGDEFVALLENISGAGEAAFIASRISASLQQPFEIDGQEVSVDVSIGIALAEEQDSAESLLRNADLAMYSAKRNRKSAYELFDPEMNARAQMRLKLENDLRRAIERGELRVYYQPKVNMKDGRLHGFEALMRWESPERGIVSPAEFLSLAEETGLLIPIGRYVLREACRQAKLWQDYYPWERPPVVCVNVSANQLRRTDVVEEVEIALDHSKLPARNLCLEITESVLMEDVESNMTALLRLKALGVKLAIDDFGTGYSSLSYLRRFPVDIIKIDRSFVNRMENDSDSATIVESVITLSHTLGLEVVAEGVETAEQFRLLRSLDCEQAQGFYFGYPLPAASAKELLTGVLLRGESLIPPD